MRMKCLVIGVGLVLGASSGAPAQAARRFDDGDRPYFRTNLFKRVLTDQRFLLTRWWPREIEGNKAFDATLVAGLAVAIQSASDRDTSQDLDWEREISGGSSRGVHSVSRDLTVLGEGPVVVAILGITYLSARRAHDDRLAEASSLAAESLLDAGIWIGVLKFATARVRPNQSDDGRFFQYGHSDSGSFPSGHAMAAFSVASVFAESYSDRKWVPWLSYGIATLIGGARLALGRHFPSDVIVGAVLGTSIGRGVVARSSGYASRPRGTFGPAVGPDGRGVGIGWRYSWN